MKEEKNIDRLFQEKFKDFNANLALKFGLILKRNSKKIRKERHLLSHYGIRLEELQPH